MEAICYDSLARRISASLIVTPLLLLATNFLQNFGSEAAELPADELSALKAIGRKLGKKDWNFSVDPCSGREGWSTPNMDKSSINNVSCDCSLANGTVCHVIRIVLKSQNLAGVLPEELSRLRFLTDFDVARNFLNGTIPTTWGSLPLTHLSLMVNRLSGRVPKELGNITTLKELNLEANKLVGTLPPEIGNLTSLSRLVLNSNNFTGELPSSFAKLTNLNNIRIVGSNFTGKIPDIFQNWTRLEILMVIGTSIEGPLPSSISSLTSLVDLRISELNGPSSTFPPLVNLTHLRVLVLRNCSISGPIPLYIWSMKKLKTLDLSFNDLTGELPPSLSSLSVNDVFLSNNKLSGSVPAWIYDNQIDVDLSKNTFSGTIPSRVCSSGNVNMLSSFSTTNGNPQCVQKNFPCPSPRYSSLYIKCGGNSYTIDGIRYEADMEHSGDSTYFYNETGHWALSITGWAMDFAKNKYIVSNQTRLLMNDSALYMTARTTTSTMTYYGLCLQNGNYNVRLHFAELIFTDDQTYRSLGERIFDVYVQGERVLTDFNIAREAGGPGKEVTKSFNASITGNTLEMSFYWAGKGTIVVPEKGVYGPLISAISVTPNFEPENYDQPSRKISTKVIILIIIFGCLFLFIILAILWMKGCLGGQSLVDKELRSLEQRKLFFSLNQIKEATQNFDPANKVGEGGFGPVYKGALPDGRVVAVKQLSSKSRQGNREFLNEITMISVLQHPNLVKLHGCCTEGKQLMLVYEYLENNSLACALFGPTEGRIKLDWRTRFNICIGIARGLAFLHEESRFKIVHRDIKTTNVLLDKDLNAKISDFGLARIDGGENSHISTRIAGTVGYMAPEYATRGYLTDKADVYSFGVVTLEIVSGQSNATNLPREEVAVLLDSAYAFEEQGRLLELVDPSLGSDFSKEEALMMINLALLCTSPSPTLRPTMSAVVQILEGKAVVNKSTCIGTFVRRDQDTMTLTESVSSGCSPWIDSSETVPSKEEEIVSSATQTSEQNILMSSASHSET